LARHDDAALWCAARPRHVQRCASRELGDGVGHLAEAAAPGPRREVARALGLHRSTLYRKLERYGLRA
jgi:transcriptional regulator of acetoin/glycerol metabolism